MQNEVVFCNRCNVPMIRDSNGWHCGKCNNRLELEKNSKGVKSMSGEGVEAKKGQVSTELDMIDGAIDRLHTSVSNMESMLATILRPESPGKEPEKVAQEELVGVADRCRNIRSSIANRTNRLEDIMKRLEL